MEVLTCENWIKLTGSYSDLSAYTCHDSLGNLVDPVIQQLPTAMYFPSLSVADGLLITSVMWGFWALCWVGRKLIEVVKPAKFT